MCSSVGGFFFVIEDCLKKINVESLKIAIWETKLSIIRRFYGNEHLRHR